jgi:hypothetical protein
MNIQINKEYTIPQGTECIVVQDFFDYDLIGGAELTTAAWQAASPYKCFDLHSASLTEQMLKQHKEKIWIFGNYTQVPLYLLNMVMELGLHYYAFEYDQKHCSRRSVLKHALEIKKPCDCHETTFGKFNAHFLTSAKVLYWCSIGQMERFYAVYPHLKGRTTDFIQGSTYTKETILNIRKIRERKEAGEIQVLDRWVILDSTSWIKGKDDSIAYCKEHRLNYVLLGGLTNEKFLEELAMSRGLIFLPLDVDVGSRITSECKLLGGTPIVNDFVLHVKEDWFKQPIPKIEEYLLDGPARFWRQVKL